MPNIKTRQFTTYFQHSSYIKKQNKKTVRNKHMPLIRKLFHAVSLSIQSTMQEKSQ